MHPVSILVALVAFILVLCAAQGVRMVSYDAAQSLSMEEDSSVRERGSLVIKVVDRAGLRFGRLLSGVYSPRRREQLERRLKSWSSGRLNSAKVYSARNRFYSLRDPHIFLLSSYW